MIMPPYVYMLNSSQPYDTARELCTRGVLQHNPEWVFHSDTDVLPPLTAIPVMIQWAKQFNLPLVSGLYWAKKPFSQTMGKPMPAAWVKIEENKEENSIKFGFLNIFPHMGKQALIKCDTVGAGCLLIKADIFKKLDASDPNKPYFQWGLARKDAAGKPLLQVSEDFYFCTRCVRELNIYPHVAVAVQCDHITSAVKRGADGAFEMLTLKG